MANIPIWDDAPGQISGSTPFGYYDTDTAYQSDGPNVAKWCSRRLGYPLIDIELQSGSFYACFEEAVSEYSAQVNLANIKDNMLNFQGASTGSSFTGVNVRDNLGRLVTLSEAYGTEAGVGGNVTLKSGSINIQQNVQVYDLDALWTNVSESGNTIEIRKIFHERSPAITRYFDPYIGTGLGTTQLLDSFGWGNNSIGVNFLMTPIYADLLRLQAIEFNDLIRKSAFSFEIMNNKLRIFPVPSKDDTLIFNYIVKEDRINPIPSGSSASGKISDIHNVPYSRLTYKFINSPGIQWIKKYTLALSKELLGAIRSKYSTIPIPGSEVTLDGSDLRQQAQTEKEALMTEIKEILEATSRRAQLESKKDQSGYMQEILNRAPHLPIYVR